MAYMIYYKIIILWEVAVLADSNITKRALAAAFKELLESQSFDKISIGDICEKCQMNRKSFYYHFKDKYDLVNWIYYTEFITVARQQEYTMGWDLLEDLCVYFYNNRNFYRKTFNIDGQNSFSDYFRDIVSMIITNDFRNIFGDDAHFDFYVDFFADAFVCSIKRWIAMKDCMPAEEFVQCLKTCLWGTSHKVIQHFSSDII
ncbi:dihydroxyacetone kinase transcriptional activator DhaS [Yanshouia hominis]|nr:dihydroxyacetone kinase transcriptional activator DhaS [Yanshouia hominis]